MIRLKNNKVPALSINFHSETNTRGWITDHVRPRPSLPPTVSGAASSPGAAGWGRSPPGDGRDLPLGTRSATRGVSLLTTGHTVNIDTYSRAAC